ncbi:hypothetical protein CVS40_8357 [Lucilia cuprina]|nr:hypothetical protein CVS40_8357 [Lucilia cuprina]
MSMERWIQMHYTNQGTGFLYNIPAGVFHFNQRTRRPGTFTTMVPCHCLWYYGDLAYGSKCNILLGSSTPLFYPNYGDFK